MEPFFALSNRLFDLFMFGNIKNCPFVEDGVPLFIRNSPDID